MRNHETRAAWEYHRRTSHASDDGGAAQVPVDWGNRPRPYKLYPRLSPISLAEARPHSCMPALDALAMPSLPRVGAWIPSDESLAAILRYSAGIVRRVTLSGSGREQAFRAASCTGALYHVDVYVVGGPLIGLTAGVYQYGPQDDALRRLRSGDWRGALAEACAEQPWVSHAPLSLVLTTTYWRNAWRYGERAYRHAFWDGGTIAANMLTLASAHGLPATVVTGFVDRTVNRLLDLDDRKEVALAVVSVGRGGRSAPPAGPVARIELQSAVYSFSESDHPAIRAMHAASSLSTADEVRAWQTAARSLAPRPLPGGIETTLPVRQHDIRDEGSLSLESTIPLRRSARRFRRAPISAEHLGTVLRAATRGHRADYRTDSDRLVSECLLLVSAVDGLTPGLYRYRPERNSVELLEARDDVRDVAGRLALDGQRAADAACCVYFLADLPSMLGALGNRGYRVAQLEAGILTGKVYLAATEVGLAVTGLTFYDDAASRLFGPHAPDHHAMLSVALGCAG